MAYFKLNKEDAFARTLKYDEIPEHYVQDNKSKEWKRRVKKCKTIGRLNYIPISKK